jgi:hypothetical protein
MTCASPGERSGPLNRGLCAPVADAGIKYVIHSDDAPQTIQICIGMSQHCCLSLVMIKVTLGRFMVPEQTLSSNERKVNQWYTTFRAIEVQIYLKTFDFG